MSMPMPMPMPRTTMTTQALISAWAEAMADVRAMAEELGDRGWRAPSLLPGWSVADVVAHLTWIERILLGRMDPPHEPDWAQLPHARSDLARATEVPVDLRRSRSRAEVLAEFDATIADRLAALRGGPQDPDTPALNPFGARSTLEAVLRMRTFDTWVHGQDIRLAVGRPGSTGTAAARVAAEQIAGALGYVWAKRVAAPIGAVLRVDVSPPGIALTAVVLRDGDGRGVLLDPADQRAQSPTASVALAFDDFVQLGCGRSRPDSTPEMARARCIASGDHDLAAAALANLNIAP